MVGEHRSQNYAVVASPVYVGVVPGTEVCVEERGCLAVVGPAVGNERARRKRHTHPADTTRVTGARRSFCPSAMKLRVATDAPRLDIRLGGIPKNRYGPRARAH